MTLISVGLKVLYLMVRMVVRGRIDPHRPAALHFIGLFFFPLLFYFLSPLGGFLTFITIFIWFK